MMTFTELVSVRATAVEGSFEAVARVVYEGEDIEVPYLSTRSDTFGIAPEIRQAIDAWVLEGNPVDDAPAPPDPRALMPTLTARQLRMALLTIGIVEADVDAALTGQPYALIEWKWASSYERLHPLIDAVGPAFSITPEQIDDLWVWAAAS